MTKPIAFIVQRYGAEITGGSEAHCRMVAEHMAQHWQVEVLTTCAKDYITWANAYPAGSEELAGVTVRRFPVAFPRKKWLFDRLYDLLAPLATPAKPRRGGRLLGPLLRLLRAVLKLTGLLGLLERAWMILQGPYSPALTRYIEEQGQRYDAIIAFSYVYATSYYGLMAAPGAALLVPTAHDDPAINFAIYQRLFRRVDHILANTHEERDLLLAKFPSLSPKQIAIVGCGIALDHLDPSPTADEIEAFKARMGITGPYVVYVGRIEPFKGCRDLFQHFLSTSLKASLVLVGKAEMAIPEDARIKALGFLSERDKGLAIAGSEALVMPSPFESLSLVLLEAWYLGRPVLVNGACEVLKGQCQRSGGGLWFDHWEDFNDKLHELLAQRASYDGKALRAFVEDNYSWPTIERRYLDGLRAAQAKQREG